MKRKSYAERSGMTSRSARILASAITEKPVFIEDADGHLIRQWKPEEMQRYGNDEIKSELRFRHVVELEDLLETIPPSAVKYCCSKGWLRKDAGGWFLVTKKAAADLGLPLNHQGRKVRFA